MPDHTRPIRNLPKPDELWKRPPQQQQGNNNTDEIFAAVGRALTNWEGAETGFSHLFSQLMFSGDARTRADRVYGSIISPGGRRDALNVASESFFHWRKVSDDDKKDYKLLMVHFERAIGRRNDIAHGMVFSVQGKGYFLIPAPYNSSKNKDYFLHIDKKEIKTSADLNFLDMHDYAYTANDVTKIMLAFRSLRDAVQDYAGSLDTYIMKDYGGDVAQSPQPEPKQTGDS